jgi:ABC1 atypical kinase-like domain
MNLHPCVAVALRCCVFTRLAIERSSRQIDTVTVEILLTAVQRMFPDFKYMWLVDEMKKNLPAELDFVSEGRNAERFASQFSSRIDVTVCGLRFMTVVSSSSMESMRVRS